MIYPVNGLPRVLPLGKQSERGVESIGIDCKEWLDKWPGMQLSVWATRPGEAESYPVVTETVGTVVYWHVNDTDTEIPGQGTAEVLGLVPTGEHRKLSRATMATLILKTTTAVTSEPSPAMKPWYDALVELIRNNVSDEHFVEVIKKYLVENPVSGSGVVIDDTMSVPGAAADAAEVGTRLANVSIAMSKRAPQDHASEDTVYGMATDKLYGHVRAAWLDKMLYRGSEENDQDPDSWYDAYGALIGDSEAAKQYLRGIVPDMWLMSWWHDTVTTLLNDHEKQFTVHGTKIAKLEKDGGGYYTPTVEQTESETLRVNFTPSNAEMPAVAPVDVTLPQGPAGDAGHSPVKGTDYWTEGDRAAIKAEALADLADVQTTGTDAFVASLNTTVRELGGRTRNLETKTKNMAEDLSDVQYALDDLEAFTHEYISKIAFRMIRIERHLGLTPPVNENIDTTLPGLDDVYDDVFPE